MIDPTTDAGRVHRMDIAFAFSAFISSSITFTQTMIYPSYPCLISTRVLVVCILFLFMTTALIETQLAIPLKSYAGLSLIDLAAFIKAGSSLIKYLFVAETFPSEFIDLLDRRLSNQVQLNSV